MLKKQGINFSLVQNRNFIFFIWMITEILQKNLMIMPVIWTLHQRTEEKTSAAKYVSHLNKWVFAQKALTMKKVRDKMKLIFAILVLLLLQTMP